MNKEEATEIAEQYVNRSGDNCSLFYDSIIEFEYGYCFIWNSNKYIESRDINDMLVGPAPFITPKEDGNVFCLGSAYSMESLIEEYTIHYEEENNIYSLWAIGKLIQSSIIRQKYKISLPLFKNVINGNAPILTGCKSRLQTEASHIEALGNRVEIKKHNK